jgi:23S rRNA (pseudouridine1915-N3)-methyltransferase
MHLIVAAVGHRMPRWVDTAFDEYAKRMPPELGLELREVKPEPRTAGRTSGAIMAIEAERIRSVLPKRARIVVLDERGDDLTTLQLADRLQRWRGAGDDVVLVIGGADGLDSTFKAEASELIRLSSLTLAHGFVRVLLAEQLYRAWSVTQNHPYHRA